MNLNNFLYSGFKFNQDEDLLQFKFKMLNSIFIIVAFFSALFGLLNDLGMNDIGPIHSKVDYLYSVLTVALIFFLRFSKTNYRLTANLLLFISLLTFTSALIFVPQDEFRMIWFFLLIFVAYMVNGKISGLLCTLASIGIILTANFFVDLHLSQTAVNSGVLGLIIGSFLSYVYTRKITDYEHSLKKQNSRLSLLASTDYLTGIMNRRMFNEISKHDFQTAQKNYFSLTLLLLDLDHFKKINDRFGHQTGDKLLIHFTQTVEKHLNKSDIFARVGGEEFAILLSQINIDDAYNFAEKIRREVETITVQHGGKDVLITTSIGISENRNTDISFDDIFSRADKALYQAKDQGRNQTCYIPFLDNEINCPLTTKQKTQRNFFL